MEYYRYVLFKLILCLICVEGGFITGKALYCRDPDTGKLHAVNSTWQSTTFCGNYSCKLRRLNKIETEYLPIRQINISNLQSEEKHIDLETSPVTIHTKIDSSLPGIPHKEANEQEGREAMNFNNDRYLTETEIKSIADMLHTVKKSDLDAIVEIYKIAQDIYKEMDKATSDSVLDETLSTANDDEKFVNEKQSSYWYEPLHISPQKGGPVDLEKQETFFKPATHKPNRSPGYFGGILSSSDFGKLPYYYPMSAFQRSSSYVHKPNAENPQTSCNKMDHSLIEKVLKKHSDQNPQAPVPYPFPYIQQYNNTALYSPMYGNPWAYLNYYRNYPYAYIAQIPSNIIPLSSGLGNADTNSVSKEEANILDSLLAKVKETKLPEWQTDPLSNQVLEEVRANIEKSKLLKPFPLRKKVNLERVGKLIKLDEFTRTKRSAELKSVSEEFAYDVYLETVTCRSDIQPGYFRMGDQNQQYPDCCPQRIDSVDD
ncbi:uncharacterized protein LOC114240966 [Bombyx mandarina]|uniref:Uncharacterized protein LOC114240966 n=1 Tax=Bombyx mandarina TaxID=7092 RepID=A0A6J2JEI1_BOMMA|nr:uncharacterized protein LOC114240966 [Bombyx mandarina]